MANVGDGTGMSGGGEAKDALTSRTDKATSPGKPYDQFGGSEGVKIAPGTSRTSPISRK